MDILSMSPSIASSTRTLSHHPLPFSKPSSSTLSPQLSIPSRARSSTTSITCTFTPPPKPYESQNPISTFKLSSPQTPATAMRGAEVDVVGLLLRERIVFFGSSFDYSTGGSPRFELLCWSIRSGNQFTKGIMVKPLPKMGLRENGRIGSRKKGPIGSPKKGLIGSRKHAHKIPKGIIHVQASFNNTIVTVTDVRGQVISWSSGGSCGFKGTRKGTPNAAQTAAINAIQTVANQGMQRAEVMIKGPGLGRDAALRAIRRSGIQLSFIRDVTPMPHNGCRRPKKRRV